MFQKKFSNKFLDGNDDLAKLFMKKQTLLKIEKQKTIKELNSSPVMSPRGHGKGNLVNYDENNTIKINYKDVDGDGEADRLVI